MIDTIHKYLKSGLSVIPTKLDTKQPTIRWKEFQYNLPTADNINAWFRNANHAVALICGAVSGNLELIDIDNHFGDAESLFNQFQELTLNTDPELWNKLIVETTQSGGYHLIYRCSAVAGNQKLAKRWKSEKQQDTLIETRGEGGYALIAPSQNYTLVQGSFTNIKTISEADRELLLDIARSFNEIVAQPEKERVYNFETDEQAGTAFNQRGDIRQTLMNAGWTLSGTKGVIEYWIRPGKDKGLSATFNANNTTLKDRFYVFSSNCYPFDSGRSYSKFAVETMLNYNSDFKQSALELSKLGYGSSKKKNGTAKPVSTFESAIENTPNISNSVVAPNGKIVEAARPQKRSKVDIIEEYLQENYDLRYNLIKSTVELKEKTGKDWVRITDREQNEIWRILSKYGQSAAKNSIDAIMNSNYVSDYNPFIDYFKNLPEWDGEDHIQEVANMFTVEEGQEDLWNLYFTKWITGVVACALERGSNHVCIVLVGPQGIGKTTIIGKLIPEELKTYYSVAQLNPADKDSKIMITESFIINLDEIESSTKEEVSYLKSLLTMENVTVRKPYGRHTEMYRRRASFIGSVNKMHFLTDQTGSRRFLPVDVVDIDLVSSINLEQLYAQALWRVNQGKQYWFGKDEIELIEKNNQKYQMITAEEELLSKHFKSYDFTNKQNSELDVLERNGVIKAMTATDILNVIQRDTLLRMSLAKLGLVLKKLGFKQIIRKINNLTKRVYMVKKIDGVVENEESKF